MATEQSFFDRAVAALRGGNPYPMLSGQATFATEAAKAQWHRAADLMLDIRTSLRSRVVSLRLADDIWRLCIVDGEVANPQLARSLLTELLAAAEANGDADNVYAEFLRDVDATADVENVVSAERERRQKVIQHVRSLLGKLSENA